MSLGYKISTTTTKLKHVVLLSSYPLSVAHVHQISPLSVGATTKPPHVPCGMTYLFLVVQPLANTALFKCTARSSFVSMKREKRLKELVYQQCLEFPDVTFLVRTVQLAAV